LADGEGRCGGAAHEIFDRFSGILERTSCASFKSFRK
jgi:hypothetical protein